MKSNKNYRSVTRTAETRLCQGKSIGCRKRSVPRRPRQEAEDSNPSFRRKPIGVKLSSPVLSCVIPAIHKFTPVKTGAGIQSFQSRVPRGTAPRIKACPGQRSGVRGDDIGPWDFHRVDLIGLFPARKRMDTSCDPSRTLWKPVPVPDEPHQHRGKDSHRSPKIAYKSSPAKSPLQIGRQTPGAAPKSSQRRGVGEGRRIHVVRNHPKGRERDAQFVSLNSYAVALHVHRVRSGGPVEKLSLASMKYSSIRGC